MGKKVSNLEREKSPGPGAYDVNHSVIKEKCRNVGIGMSKRPDIAPKTARETPGPGVYDSP